METLTAISAQESRRWQEIANLEKHSEFCLQVKGKPDVLRMRFTQEDVTGCVMKNAGNR